jgi:hypothetical protein
VAALNKRPLGAPPNAVTFGLVRMLGTGDRGKPGKVTGEPLEDGTVPERWAVSEFSPKNVLAAFGPDHYRVDWYASDGKRISGQTFRVAHPAPKGAKIETPGRGRPSAARRRADESDDEARGASAASGDSMSFREFLAMQQEMRRDEERREERNDERRRQEAAAAQQRDREFMATVMGALMQTREQPAASSDLIRRELSLEIRQGMQRLREELGNLEPEEPEDEREPAEDLGEGMARVGSAVLGELEQRAPHLVNELIPQVAEWLKQKGFVPSPEVQGRLQRTVTNGRGNAGQS